MTRKRVKIGGKMVAGTVRETQVEIEGLSTKQHQVQLVTKIDQSLGNCPKYLNQYELQPALVEAKLFSTGSTLPDKGRALVNKSDMFFLSTSANKDMDVNHRGGPPGFVRISAPNQIVYPEYSGNRLYQSLGNLLINPKIGITFPDYESGDVLYITGTTDVLVGEDASTLLPGSNLAVLITIVEARFVQHGLPFRGTRKMPSPYNPRVRPLAAEGNVKSNVTTSTAVTARLVKKSLITPSVARFTFTVPAGITYSAGQWVAMDFKDDLDTGYEHMRDEDPLSLNDDFVRTFTISSKPKSTSPPENEFDITIRKVGPVTKFLFQQNVRAGFEVPILGVGGDFTIQQNIVAMTPFVAGGVGITPLLASVHTLDLSPARFKLFWTIRSADVDLAIDTLQRHSELAKLTEVFLTGSSTQEETLDAKHAQLRSLGVQVHGRRMTRSDIDAISAQTWYLCASKQLRNEILSWLEGQKVVFEDFDY
jgi:ferredoxin-NADP reductase